MLTGTIVYSVINSTILILVALGFNLTFGVSGVANFAYGALYIQAGFLTWIFMNTLGLPYLTSAGLAVIATAIAGALLYKLVLQRVRGIVLSEVMATFGISLVILELYRYFDFVGYEYTLPVFIDDIIEFGDIIIDYQRAMIVVVGLVIAVLLWLFTHQTRIGLAFRGISQDEQTALTLGIDSDLMATLSVAFGGALAAIAAITILPLSAISVDQGGEILISALAVCIVGGLGSTPGIFVAGIVIGFTQTFTSAYLGANWVLVVPPLAILLVLAIRPSGLLGSHKQLEERV